MELFCFLHSGKRIWPSQIVHPCPTLSSASSSLFSSRLAVPTSAHLVHCIYCTAPLHVSRPSVWHLWLWLTPCPSDVLIPDSIQSVHSQRQPQHFNLRYLESFLEETAYTIQRHLVQVLYCHCICTVTELRLRICQRRSTQRPSCHSSRCLDCVFADTELNWTAFVEGRLCTCSAVVDDLCWLPGADVTVRSAARWLCGTLRLGTCYRCFPQRC